MVQKKQDIAPMSPEHRNEAILFWQLHDTLLQNYRMLFLTFESIAITAGGFVAFNKIQVPQAFPYFQTLLDIFIIVYLIFAGPVFILLVWKPIVNHRNKMVSFTQWLISTNEKRDESPFNLMGKFSKENSEYHQAIIARDDYRKLLHGPTRTKLDTILPWAFIIFWGLLLFWKLIGNA